MTSPVRAVAALAVLGIAMTYMGLASITRAQCADGLHPCYRDTVFTDRAPADAASRSLVGTADVPDEADVLEQADEAEADETDEEPGAG